MSKSIALTVGDLPPPSTHSRLRTRATPEQIERFAVGVVFDGLSRSKAYRLAFPDRAATWQKDSISSACQRFAANVVVSARVRALEMEQAKSFDYNVDELLQKYHGIADADIGEIYDDNGNIKPLRDMPKQLRKAIKAVKHTVTNKVIGIDEETGVELTEPVTTISEIQLEARKPAIDKLLEAKLVMLGFAKSKARGDSSTGFAHTHPDTLPETPLEPAPTLDVQEVARKMLSVMQEAERSGLAGVLDSETRDAAPRPMD